MKVALIVIVTVAIAVKAFEHRVPPAVYRALVTIGILLPLVATVYAICLLWQDLIGWRELALFLGLYVATGLGTTLGYHRLATHRSFDAHPAVKLVFYALDSMAL